MWITLLVMAVAVSLEPFRIGMSVLMLNRPRPLLQLTAFLCGGFLMGLTVGMVVLFLLESRLPESAHFTLPRVQVAIGVLALLAAAVLALTTARPRARPPWLTRLLAGQSLWVASAAGLGIALPSVDYLAALAVIGTADVSSTTRLAALLTFNVVAFALVEIPLLAYLVAPERTRARLAALNDWLQAQGRRGVATMVAVVGVVLLGVGLAGW
ncbi:GAP family protein [Mycobacterium sp. AMU20-3851]|uniref:GAP family protein n=1 Tax=Mycobacterium sp. AMU20-3851 TaxID=3122055 RepID=UPI0037547EEF